MGNWGPGNLENDYALDELGDRVDILVESLIERARRKSSRECDDYDYTTLFVDFEMVFALDAKKLLACNVLPPSDEVEELKWDYIRDWDVNIDALGSTPEFKKDRRQCILRTFNRFKRICKRREDQVAASPEWVVIEPPTLAELMNGVAVTSHLVFKDLLISLPETWTARTTNDLVAAPDSLLVRRFTDSDSQRFVAKAKLLDAASEKSDVGGLQEHAFHIGGVFLATGRSLVPADVPQIADPYILLMQLRSADGAKVPNVYDLIFGTDDVLSPFYQGEGEYVSGGPYCIDTPDQLEFLGLESFRRPPPGSQEELAQYQSLFYHPVSDDALLLLEYGSLGYVMDDHFPDKVLVDHLVASLKPAPQDTDD